MTLVSVVIPAFNCAKFLPQTIDSVLGQCYGHLEVIVVDDGSTDNTPEVLERYRGRIRIYRQENRGVSKARNTGVEISRGEWIAFLDADDLWVKDKISGQVKVHQAACKPVLSFSDGMFIDETGLEMALPGIRGFYPVFGRYGVSLENRLENHLSISAGSLANWEVYWGNAYPTLLLGNFIPTSTVMVRKDVLLSAGMFNESLKSQEDYDLWLRIGKDHHFHYIDEPLFKYRRRKGQLTSLQNNADVIRISLDLVVDAYKHNSHFLNDPLHRRRLGDKYKDRAVSLLFNGEYEKFKTLMRQATFSGIILKSLHFRILKIVSFMPSWLIDRFLTFYRYVSSD